MVEAESSPNIWDREFEKSVINLVPTVVRDHCETAALSRPDLVGLPERELLKALRKQGKSPTPNDNRLRLSFWNEYDRAQDASEKMSINQVVHGICQLDYLYNDFFLKPHKVLWLLTPPASYEVLLEEALHFGIEQIRDVFEIPNTVDGKLDHKLVQLKARLVKTMEAKKRGSKMGKPAEFQPELQEQPEPTEDFLKQKLIELEKREKLSRNVPIVMEEE